MGSVSQFGFLNAKLKARIGVLKDSSLLDDLIKAPNLVEAFSVLKEKGYPELSDVYDKSGDIEEVELEIFKEEIESYRQIRAFLPKKALFFMDVLEEKLELENLKSAIRMWYSDFVRHHQLRDRAAYLYKGRIVSDINWDGVVNALSWEDLEKAVKESPYFETISSFKYESISRDGLFDLEIALDNLYFSRLFKAIDRLSGDDRMVTRAIYLKDMDLKNILLLIRYGYYHRLERDKIEKIAIPFGMVYRDLKENGYFERGDLIKGIRDSVNHRYSALVEDIEQVSRESEKSFEEKGRTEREILKLEGYLHAVRDKEYRSLLSKDPFSIGIMLSYLYLKTQMYQKIRSILTLKRYSWSEERIREAFK